MFRIKRIFTEYMKTPHLAERAIAFNSRTLIGQKDNDEKDISPAYNFSAAFDPKPEIMVFPGQLFAEKRDTKKNIIFRDAVAEEFAHASDHYSYHLSVNLEHEQSLKLVPVLLNNLTTLLNKFRAYLDGDDKLDEANPDFLDKLAARLEFTEPERTLVATAYESEKTLRPQRKQAFHYGFSPVPAPEKMANHLKTINAYQRIGFLEMHFNSLQTINTDDCYSNPDSKKTELFGKLLKVHLQSDNSNAEFIGYAGDFTREGLMQALFDTAPELEDIGFASVERAYRDMIDFFNEFHRTYDDPSKKAEIVSTNLDNPLAHPIYPLLEFLYAVEEQLPPFFSKVLIVKAYNQSVQEVYQERQTDPQRQKAEDVAVEIALQVERKLPGSTMFRFPDPGKIIEVT